jgi:ATP-binding cassette, subfamily B, bacterial
MGWITEGLDKDDYDRNYSDRELFRRIIKYFSPYKLPMSFLSLAILFEAFANAFILVLIALLIARIEENPSIDAIRDLIFLIGSFNILVFLMIATREVATAKSVQGAIRDLRRDTFKVLIRRDFSFFDKEPSGKIASRITNDTTEFGTTVTLTSNLVSQLFAVVFIIFFLSQRSLKLTIILAFIIPLITIIALSYRKIARFVSLRSQRVIAKVNSLIQETTSGIYIAKSFRAEQTVYDEFDKLNKQNYKTSLFRQIVFISIFPVLTMVNAISTSLIIYLVGMEVINADSFITPYFQNIPGEPLTVGDWFLFIQAISFFLFPIIQIASYWSQFQLGMAASERIFSIMDADTKIVQYDNEEIRDMNGKIEFRDLTFGYDDENMVLNNFNLTIQPGEKIAIVGHTGAGKSTLSKLIARYYEFQDGKLLIDDHNIRSLDLSIYRKNLAIISQEVFLWNGSVRDNLLYGVDLTNDIEQKLFEVLEKVEVLDWIKNTKEGLDVHIGERGGNLSMGQRQLIAFARILLRDPKILIMDEATASVDPLTEVQIQKATNLLLEGRTSIIIAHRLSTIRNVDRIIVMKDGNIIEQGSHKELLGHGGHYAELYDTYFRHQSLEYIESLVED